MSLFYSSVQVFGRKNVIEMTFIWWQKENAMFVGLVPYQWMEVMVVHQSGFAFPIKPWDNWKCLNAVEILVPWLFHLTMDEQSAFIVCSILSFMFNHLQPSSQAGYQKTLDKSIFPDICPDLGHWHPQTIYLLFVMCSHNPALILFSGDLQCWIIDWATIIGRTSKIKKC